MYGFDGLDPPAPFALSVRPLQHFLHVDPFLVFDVAVSAVLLELLQVHERDTKDTLHADHINFSIGNYYNGCYY